MLERLFIGLALIGVGVALYQLSRWWLVYRTRQFTQMDDPVLRQLDGKNPAILYFTADFCTACKSQQKPALTRLREQWGDDMQIIIIDAERQPEIAKQWRVMSLPTTFVLSKDGTTQSMNFGVTQTAELNLQLIQAQQRSA